MENLEKNENEVVEKKDETKLLNCDTCGRLFSTNTDETTCKKCRLKEEEDDLRTIRNYLFEYPNAKVTQIAEGTGIHERTILRLMRYGKIKVVNESDYMIKCKSCGKIIVEGEICESCKREELHKELRKLARDLNPNKDENSTFSYTTQKESAIKFHSRYFDKGRGTKR